MTATHAPAGEDESVEKSLAGEDPLLDVTVEEQGVKDILAALTDDEKAGLADPNMPLRHFRAEKGKTLDAIRKIKETLAWRNDFQVDKIKHCFDEDGDEEMRAIIQMENETGKIYCRGYDKDGRVAMYMRPHCENTKHELNNMRHLVYNMERAIACTAKKSGLEKINLIIDYRGFRLRDSPPMSTSKHTLDILQKHYPERMYRAYVCNPPLVFRTFWTLIRPFVDPTTKEKICFCHGKAGIEKLAEKFDVPTMEPCAGGPETLRAFDSTEFLSLPFHSTFDEGCNDNSVPAE